MEEVIERVGLPVKCRLCGDSGRVKPHTDYGGWQKRKTILGLSWYCPKHPGAVERLSQQQPGSIPIEQAELTKDSLDELMNLI